MMLAGRPDPQSYLALKLLYEVERSFPKVHIRVYELYSDEVTCLRSLAEELGLEYVSIRQGSRTYTCYKVKVLELASELKDPLVVIPFTAEDVAEYLLSEVLTGSLEGMLLDAYVRVAYPLMTRTLNELKVACSCAPRSYPHLKDLRIRDVRSAKAFYEILIAQLSRELSEKSIKRC